MQPHAQSVHKRVVAMQGSPVGPHPQRERNVTVSAASQVQATSMPQQRRVPNGSCARVRCTHHKMGGRCSGPSGTLASTSLTNRSASRTRPPPSRGYHLSINRGSTVCTARRSPALSALASSSTFAYFSPHTPHARCQRHCPPARTSSTVGVYPTTPCSDFGTSSSVLLSVVEGGATGF